MSELRVVIILRTLIGQRSHLELEIYEEFLRIFYISLFTTSKCPSVCENKDEGFPSWSQRISFAMMPHAPIYQVQWTFT